MTSKVGPDFNPAYDPAYPPPMGGQPPPPPMYNTAGAYPASNAVLTPSEPPPPASQPKLSDGSDGRFDDNSFSNNAVRLGFIRKVYGLLFTQLIFTFSVVMVFSIVIPVKKFVQDNSLFFFLSFAVFFVTFIILICIKEVRRKHPWNLICLGIFTLSFTYMTATLSSYYSTAIVALAVGMTAMICLSISLFAIQTKIDFTTKNILLFVIVMILFYFGVSCIIMAFGVRDGRILDAVFGGLCCIVLSAILIYDTQKIVGGRGDEMDPEEYVYGALQLYLSIVIIFLIILSMFGKK